MNAGSPSDPFALLNLRRSLAEESDRQRRIAIGHLISCFAAGEEVARRLEGWEARLLQEAHRRIPHGYMVQIDPNHYSGADQPEERLIPPCNYACVLAGELERLVLVGCDVHFPSPDNREDLEWAEKLIEKLIACTPAESSALETILSASLLSFVGTISYDRWWYPAMLIRILRNPELDRLPHHC